MIDNRIKGIYVLFVSLNFFTFLVLTNILAKQPYVMNIVYSFATFLLVSYGFFLLNSSSLRRDLENLLIVLFTVSFATFFIHTTQGALNQYFHFYGILLAYGAFDRGKIVFHISNITGLALLSYWSVIYRDFFFILQTEIILGVAIYLVLVMTIRQYSLNCINCTLSEECSRGDRCSLYKAKRSYKEFGVEVSAKSFEKS